MQTATAHEQCINQQGTPHTHTPPPKKIILTGKLNTHAQWILDPQPHPQPILMGENKKEAQKEQHEDTFRDII